MEKLTITLKTVTPLFLGGADGKTPELRAPSIKGIMRFWWRAMNWHLSIKDLRKKEGDLFGSSDEKVGRSKFSLFVHRTVESDDDFIIPDGHPLPHHTGDKNCKYLNINPGCNRNGRCSKVFPSRAIAQDKTFECIIRAHGDEDINRVLNIFKVSLILGGLGKRSRRGFGSIKILKVNGSDFCFDYTLDSICGLVNLVIPSNFNPSSTSKNHISCNINKLQF